jgi:hypothetical protein
MIRTLPKRTIGLVLTLLMLLGSVETALGAHACAVHDGPGHGGGHGSEARGDGSGARGDDSPTRGPHGPRGHIDHSHGPSDPGDPHEDGSCTCPGACVVATGVVVPSEHWRSVAPVAFVSTPAAPVAAAPANRLHSRNFLPFSLAPPAVS